MICWHCGYQQTIKFTSHNFFFSNCAKCLDAAQSNLYHFRLLLLRLWYFLFLSFSQIKQNRCWNLQSASALIDSPMMIVRQNDKYDHYGEIFEKEKQKKTVKTENDQSNARPIKWSEEKQQHEKCHEANREYHCGENSSSNNNSKAKEMKANKINSINQ